MSVLELPETEETVADGNEKGLACRRCGCRDLRVYYTRKQRNGQVLRRRYCRNCGERVFTVERERE